MSATATEPARLAHKDTEVLLGLMRRLARENGNTITFKLNGTGHVSVCDADGKPLALRDGSPFAISTTPKGRGAWKQAALKDACRIGLIKREQITHGDRRTKVQQLTTERAALVATRNKTTERIAAIDKQIARLA